MLAARAGLSKSHRLAGRTLLWRTVPTSSDSSMRAWGCGLTCVCPRPSTCTGPCRQPAGERGSGRGP